MEYFYICIMNPSPLYICKDLQGPFWLLRDQKEYLILGPPQGAIRYNTLIQQFIGPQLAKAQ